MFNNNKRNSIQAFLLLIIFLISVNSFATKRYWVGNGSNINWNATANWSATSGGASGASIPVSTDSTYFDGNGLGQCSINATVSIKRLDVSSAYTDTIKQNTYGITVGTSGMILSGGTFWGGSGQITDQGIFTLSGMYFKSTSGLLTIQNDYTFSSGTFSHNNGEVMFTGVFNITGNTTLHDCTFYPLSGVGGTYTLGSTTVLTINDSLAYLSVIVNSGSIDVYGEITADGTSVGYLGNTTINIVGTSNQTIYGHTNHASLSHGWLPNIKINKSSGTLYLRDAIVVRGKWEWVAGTVDATTYNSIISFPSGNSNQIIGKQTLNDVHIGTSGGTADTMIVKAGDTLTILGTLSSSGNGPTVIKGYVDLKGDWTIGNLSTLNYLGTGIVNINGTGTQTINGSNAVNKGRLAHVKINKPSGTLVLKDYIPVGGDWIYLQGTVDDYTNTNTVVFNVCPAGRMISGNSSLKNVTFYTASGYDYFNTPANDSLTVTGLLEFAGASINSFESGVIKVKGNLTVSNTHNATNSVGVGTLLICGSGDQTITGATDVGDGRVANVKISKTGGTLFLKNTFSVQGNWTYTQGTIDATTFNSTVAFMANTVNNVPRIISGNHTLNNVSLSAISYTSLNDIPANDTLTVLGELKIEGTALMRINDGTINQKGDINIANTGVNVTSTGLINICGTADQTITGTSTALQGKLCNVTINKPSGVLILKNIISLADAANWKFLNGTLDATTYNSTVVFTRGTRTIQGNQTFFNLHFNSPNGNGVNNINTNDTLTVEGELKISGIYTATLNTGAIKAKGDITITNTNTSVGGTGLVKICGTGNQTLTGSGIVTGGRLPNVSIDKPSGILTLSSIISFYGNWIYTQGTVEPGTSTVVNGLTANISCGTVLSTAMAFYHFRVYAGAPILTGVLKVNGTLTIDASRTLNANGKNISIGGNWNNSGTFTYSNSTVGFTGTGSQYLIKSSGTETFHVLGVNKPSGKLYLTKPISVTSSMIMTKGVIATTATNIINIPDNAISGVGSDSCYVAGPIKKTGDDAFIFPLGDTLLSTGAYHPLSITAPSVITDAYTGQYFAKNVMRDYPNYTGIQTDSIESISNCEYFNLIRNAGTSVVIPTVSWNTNSCNVETYDNLRAAYWDAGNSQWRTLGPGTTTVKGPTGTVAGSFGFATATLHLALAKFAIPSNYCAVLKRELDGGYHIVNNGNLTFKYDEEYNDLDSKLKFNIYTDQNVIAATNLTMPVAFQPAVLFGDNRITLNIASCSFTPSGNLGSGFFILEVINEKNEKWYLRFKHNISISGLCSGIPGGWSP